MNKMQELYEKWVRPNLRLLFALIFLCNSVYQCTVADYPRSLFSLYLCIVLVCARYRARYRWIGILYPTLTLPLAYALALLGYTIQVMVYLFLFLVLIALWYGYWTYADPWLFGTPTLSSDLIWYITLTSSAIIAVLPSTERSVNNSFQKSVEEMADESGQARPPRRVWYSAANTSYAIYVLYFALLVWTEFRADPNISRELAQDGITLFIPESVLLKSFVSFLAYEKIISSKKNINRQRIRRWGRRYMEQVRRIRQKLGI